MESKSEKRKRLDAAYIKHADRLYQVLLRYAKEDRYISDVVHDSFLLYYDNMERIDDDTLFGWLYEVGKNKIKSLYKREKEIATGNGTICSLLAEDEQACSAEEEYFNAHKYKEICSLRRGIFERLKDVNPQWYDLLMKVCIMDMPQKDVAKQLKVSVPIIHGRLHRARTWIRENYKEELDNKLED